jgi:hypothetical protein
MEKGQSFQQVVLKQLDCGMQKMDLDSNHVAFIKTNSKWVIHLNESAEV